MAEVDRVTRRPLGELLIQEGWAAASDVAQALADQADQADLGLRLASLLISRGLLDADQAARALGRQHGVPAALLRHLEARDPQVAASLPADVAHGFFALPLGVARDGSVVVCVRQPDSPEVRGALERALGCLVTLVVASEHVLLPLLSEVYGPPPYAFEIDVSFGEPGAAGDGGADSSFDPGAGTDFDPYAAANLTLANLDDERVVRDPSQIAARGRELDPPSWLPRATPVSSAPVLSGKQTPPRTLPRTLPPASPRAPLSPASPRAPLSPASPPASASPASRASPSSPPAPSAAQLVALAAAAMAAAQRRDQLLDAAFTALTPMWAAAAFFSIKDGAALGQRGFGGLLTAQAVATLVVPLQSPSLVRRALQTHALAEGPIAGAVQERLLRLLGGGRAFAVAVEISGRVVGVLVAARPADEQAPPSLLALARRLGEHFGRLILAAKKPS